MMSKTFGAEDPTNYRGFSISGFVGTDTMDDLLGAPSVVRTNKEVEAPGVYADVLTLGVFDQAVIYSNMT